MFFLSKSYLQYGFFVFRKTPYLKIWQRSFYNEANFLLKDIYCSNLIIYRTKVAVWVLKLY